MSEEVKVRRGSLDDLTPDDRNMNKHTSYGMSLIEKSIRKHKFGRSILVDKNDRIIGGNGVTETAASIGATKTIVVETTGDELVVVKRTDVDLDSKEGREQQLGRKCYMMELDPHYCDVIIARWEKLTGKKAEMVA